MKKLIYICIIISSVAIKNSYAQNLVPNPSFELYDTCPYSGSQISFANPWKGITTNSTDYFNACSSTYTGVPRCGAGWQYARTGGAYAAIWAINGYGSNYREYIRVQLSTALVHDSCYLVEFYCNVYNLSCFGIDKMAAYISTTPINTVGPGVVLQSTPQIVSNQPLGDTLNWMRVSGFYKANGGEQFITIGNFNTDITTDTTNVRESGCSGSYYLIDDVSIIKVPGCDTTTSIHEYDNGFSFKLYPNPNNGSMTLQYHLASTDVSTLEITDVTGKIMDRYELSSASDVLKLNEEGLKNGIYIYHIIVNGKIIKSDKLLIIK